MISTIHKLDTLIEYETNLSHQDFFEKISFLIQEYELIDHKRKFIEFLFDKENEKHVQKLIAFTLIRVLNNQDVKIVKENLHLIVKHITSSLPELCNLLNISEKTETFEKINILNDYVREREKEFNENLFFEGKLKDFNIFQQNLRRVINNRKSMILFEFTGDLFSRAKIDKIFSKINDYISAPEELKFDTFSEADDSLDSLIIEAESINTVYSIKYAANPFRNLRNTLNKDIENSPYFLPAVLEIYKTEKKYPFFKGCKSKLSIGIANVGRGYGSNTILRINDYNKDYFYFPETEQLIGEVKFENLVVEFEYEVIENIDSILMEVNLSWNSNFNQKNLLNEIVELKAQTSNIDWESVKRGEPYNLEPVENTIDLIGREIILRDLKSMQNSPLGSAFIYGQRRVGKTSIVKTLLNSKEKENLLIYYIEAGDWNSAQNPFDSMTELGEKICKKIKKSHSKFMSLQIPNFNGSLNKLSNFLDDVQEIDINFKMLIILDEFDRISRSLYERGDIGQSFVLTLRAISNRPQFGFILVGGEKLEYILTQWQEFNKYKQIRVDYFSKEQDWDDFKKLIRKPVENVLEISDSAINYIYEETAGNPYFTKKICMELFKNMVNNRDIHVTINEVKQSTANARHFSFIGATDFSHFWEDGIKGKIEKEVEISIKRRKVLILLSNLIRTDKKLLKSIIVDKAFEVGLKNSETEKYLVEFEQRKILGLNNEEYFFIVKFFKEWLINGGTDKIVATFEEEEQMITNLQIEESLKIKSEEILQILSHFKEYKGVKLTIENIREWLDQFEDVADQRIIFKLLSNFKLYNEDELRDKLERLFKRVKIKFIEKDNVRVHLSGKLKRDDILVSCLDNNLAKGAPYFANIFANVNNIYAGNACFPAEIEKNINSLNNLKALVIIDDFIGSGNTMKTNIKKYFHEELCDSINKKGIFVIIGAITGFADSIENVQQSLEDLGIEINFEIIDLLHQSDKCFNSNSNIFANPLELKKAKNICLQKGEILEPKFPLGYSESQSLIAFPMNCPNNTLPIFWKETKNWKPLFKRH